MAIRTRRSTIRLTAPAPGPDELLDLLSAAATAPDHGQLRPWRVIAISGDARARLGEAAAEAAPTADLAERILGKHLRAPLMLALVFQPREHPSIPRWEQLAATSAMTTTLLLLLDTRGWGGVWFGGPYPDAPQVRTPRSWRQRAGARLPVRRHPRSRRGDPDSRNVRCPLQGHLACRRRDPLTSAPPPPGRARPAQPGVRRRGAGCPPRRPQGAAPDVGS
ncbi:nitroreductase family protein [Streptomyces anulatus]|uniref:nitroreductase family protein n=1 Tax=Streptomyces anulatus TaxID=1892 RepID=UPI00371E2081